MRRSMFAALLVLACSAVARAETLESFKKTIHAKVSAYKSLQYKTKVVSEIVNEQMTYKSNTEQTAQFVKQGEKSLSHVETKTSSQTKMTGMDQKMEATSLDVCDGQYAYNYTDSSGQKTATKRKVDPKKDASPFDPMRGFKMSEEHFTMKMLPDETIDGKPVYVVEMTLKEQPQGMPMGASRIYYDKGTGISVKSVTLDDKGKPATTMTTTDIKIDANVPADRFVFKAPEGVPVTDADAKQPAGE